MQELLLRLRLPLNTFWKRTRWVMLGLFAVCVGIGDFSDVLLGLGDNIPENVVQWAKYGRVVGATGAFLASLTVKDTQKMEFGQKLQDAKDGSS